jgi:excisionase family DNA binding protein
MSASHHSHSASIERAQEQEPYRDEGAYSYKEAELLTVHQVANQLRVDDMTVRRWIKNGVLEAIVLPHRGARHAYRIRRSTLDALLAAPAQLQSTHAADE